MPAYNSEQFIETAINSIQQQTFKDWELLIIDDGSIDNTLNIAKQYAKLDSRIKISHQENKGQSAARNCLLASVSGEYIMFLDSDDWFYSEDVFQKCVDAMSKEIDLVVFNAKFFDENKEIKHLALCPPVYPETSTIIKVPENPYCASFSNVCFGCFKNRIIKENNINFQNGRLFEDWDFMIDYSTYCKNINYINEPFYIYRNNPHSSTKKMGERVFDIFYIYDIIQKKLSQRNLWNEYQKITFLKIMETTPRLFFNMKETITSDKIVNDYLQRTQKIFRTIPTKLFYSYIPWLQNKYFIMGVREITNFTMMLKKIKLCKHIVQVILYPVGILKLFGLKNFYKQLRLDLLKWVVRIIK